MVDALTAARAGLYLAALIGIIWTALACGNQPPDPVTPAPDPASLLAETATNLRAIRSAEFEVTHEVGSMYVPNFGAKITEIAGTWDATSGTELSIDAYLVARPEVDPQSGSYVQLRAVVTPQGYFSIEPISGLWLKQPTSSAPLSVNRLQHIVSDLVGEIENPVLVGEEAIDGVPTYRIRGSVSASSMDWLPITASEGQSLQIEVWTDTGQKLLRRINAVGAVGVFDSPETSRTIFLTNIGEPVTITRPEQFIDLSGG